MSRKFVVESVAWKNEEGNIVALKIPKVKFYPVGEEMDKSLRHHPFLVYVEVDDEKVIEFLKSRIKFEDSETSTKTDFEKFNDYL